MQERRGVLIRAEAEGLWGGHVETFKGIWFPSQPGASAGVPVTHGSSRLRVRRTTGRFVAVSLSNPRVVAGSGLSSTAANWPLDPSQAQQGAG